MVESSSLANSPNYARSRAWGCLLISLVAVSAGCNQSGDAVAVLRVRRSATVGTASEFEVYKNTQAQLLKSTMVLQAALTNPSIKSLAIVKKQQNAPQWLQSKLSVQVPGSTELMQVQLKSTGDPTETTSILDAVVEAYLTEIVEQERQEGLDRLATLEARMEKLSGLEASETQADIDRLRSELAATAQVTLIQAPTIPSGSAL